MDGTMSLGLILVIVFIIFLVGGFSGRFGGYGYGYGHGRHRRHLDYPGRPNSHGAALGRN
jgi:hypothetical protein